MGPQCHQIDRGAFHAFICKSPQGLCFRHFFRQRCVHGITPQNPSTTCAINASTLCVLGGLFCLVFDFDEVNQSVAFGSHPHAPLRPQSNSQSPRDPLFEGTFVPLPSRLHLPASFPGPVG